MSADPRLPFAFTVTGSPVSHQSHNRAALAAWQALVRTAAAARWTGPPIVDRPLQIVVECFFVPPPPRLDIDNLLKPIQDALNGLVYADDGQVMDGSVRKTSIGVRLQAEPMPPTLGAAIEAGVPFVYVEVAADSDHSRPLEERT